jgi:phosphoadenosine phosphosulfate reductase
MYNYEWDKESGGYTLSTKVIGVTKEVRPVYAEELRFLGLDKNYGWHIPSCEGPLMWAEGRRYIYFGECVGEAQGGGLYTMPIMKNVVRNIDIIPVDIDKMVAKSENLLNGLVQRTLKTTYETYLRYKEKTSIFYVAFSGGKDSVVMLDLIQRAIPHDSFVVVFGNTTMEMSVTYNTVAEAKKRWSELEWYEAKAPFDAQESWMKLGYPARKLRWCCNVHKTAPSIQVLRKIHEKRYPGDSKPFRVMVFDGVRAEESDARSTYSMVSEGNKHAVQFNCSPILEWNTTELFIYLFANKLPINELYRYGSHRVGCKLCPMGADWYECVLNHVYPEEVYPLISIIESMTKKDFSTIEERKEYIERGGWKSRVGGKDIHLGDNKITEIKKGDEILFIIKDGNYKWDTWIAPVGEFAQIGDKRYSIEYKEINMPFEVSIDKGITTIKVPILVRTKASIRFMYLFKNALNKAAYCVNCGACMAECAFNALAITNNDIIINDCKHCESCLDTPKGCIVARSLGITGGGNNMSTSNISRYQNFGFRLEWLEMFFEMGDDFWTNERMGKYMFISLKTWMKEAAITDNNTLTQTGLRLSTQATDSPVTWGLIYANIAYNSPLFNWYIRKLEYNQDYSNDDMIILLGDLYSLTVKKNALSSLKETLRLSPVGYLLGQGECEMRGKQVISIKKTGWRDPEPLVVLYCLYLFAEHSDGLYSFTLSELLDDSDEREAMSPKLIFGIDRETLRAILQGLANDFRDFINVDFNMGIMDNIFLVHDKSSSNVVDLI